MADALTVLAILGALVGLALWGLKRYRAISADGTITLGELTDALEDAAEKVEETAEAIKEAVDGGEA